jgi:hypothetical protein
MGLEKQLAELAAARAEREFALGDTLDVKMSVVLAIAVFLAGQSDELLRSNPGPIIHALQMASVAALIVGGVFAIAELWPRDYPVEADPAKFRRYAEEIQAQYHDGSDSEQSAEEEFARGVGTMAEERATATIQVNKKKSALLSSSFYAIAIAFLLNITTIAIRLF